MAFRKIKGSFKNKDASTHVIEDTYLVHDTSTGELRIGDGVTPGGTVVGGGVTVQDDGTALDNKAEVLNFVGEGVSVTGSGGTKTITITADLGELQIALLPITLQICLLKRSQNQLLQIVIQTLHFL